MSIDTPERMAAINRARAEPSVINVIGGVKDVIEDELRELSPDARIVRTNYFNHSYMPDLVLEWGEGRRTSTRSVFIRNYLSASLAAIQLPQMASAEAVVLGLDKIEGEEQGRGLREAASNSPRLLVSDAAGLNDFNSEIQVRSNQQSYPLLDLVGKNLLRGGKGLVTTAEATRVAETAQFELTEDADTALTQFDALTTEFFQEDAALRLRRAADIVRIATLADPDAPILSEYAGTLSDAELRVLLPYLLRQERGRVAEQFWAFVGAMMDLERLESFWEELLGLDINPLVQANAHTWLARRAQVTLNTEFDEEFVPPPTWQMSAGRLVAIFGPWLLTLTSKDPRRLRGRPDGVTPPWEEIAPRIASRYALDDIDLSGVGRRIRIRGEESGDVARDVRAVQESISDSYRVYGAGVRLVGQDTEFTLEVDFRASVVTAPSPRVSIFELGFTALDLLGHTRPIAPDALEHMLHG